MLVKQTTQEKGEHMKKLNVAYVPIGVPTFHLESAKKLFTQSIDLLKEFVETNSQSVIVTPRAMNNAPISAVSWTKLVQFESVNVDALQKFLLLNKNKTHEPLAK